MGQATARGFRADINGLRAWAVVAVVLYHFEVAGLQGGFVGVDVFFVISGFLMTGIVLSALQSGHFSLWQFYWARVRRIVPALLVVCAALLAIGWFTLLPEEYRHLARYVRDSLSFTSNLRYLDEAGYFDAGAHEKWLLHTWSLSVEWQFYLLLPVVLWALWKVSSDHRAIVVGLCLMFAASLGWCVHLTDLSDGQASRAFFTWQARSWELLAGALVFLLAGVVRLPGLLAKRLSWLGLAMILAAILCLTPQMAWPGWRALLPVAGTALVLLAHRSDSRWTSSRLAQWLGDRSYSIYLWHWPVVVGLAYLDHLGEVPWVAGGIALALLLGHCSFVWVEGPSRRALGGRGAVPLMAGLAALLLVVGAAQVVRKMEFPERLPAAVSHLELAAEDHNPRREECLSGDANCVYGGKQVRAILLGDSHADAVVTAAAASLADPRQGVLFKGEHGCLILPGASPVEPDKRHCRELNEWVEKTLPQSYPGVPVVLLNRWAMYLFGGLPDETDLTPGKPRVYIDRPYATPTREFLDEFRQRYLASLCSIAEHHPLYLLRPIPEMGRDVPRVLARGLILGRPEAVSLPRDGYMRRQAFVWALQDEAVARCGARILDPLPYLCNTQSCLGSDSGVPLYVDDDHLSETGNRRLIPLFSQLFGATAASAAQLPLR
ncbi:Acyltransferase family protein [compost metagenome]